METADKYKALSHMGLSTLLTKRMMALNPPEVLAYIKQKWNRKRLRDLTMDEMASLLTISESGKIVDVGVKPKEIDMTSHLKKY